MEREEKKYEVLPGVKTPDIKTILDAASDFTNPGVDNVMIKGGDIRKSLSTSGDSKTHIPSQEEIQNLQNLGDKVAADELRAMEESRKKMDEIMQKVMAPESMKDLRKAAASKIVSEEKREQLDKERAEIEAKQAEEEAKNKAREESSLSRRFLKRLSRRRPKKRISEKKKRSESRRKKSSVRRRSLLRRLLRLRRPKRRRKLRRKLPKKLRLLLRRPLKIRKTMIIRLG